MRLEKGIRNFEFQNPTKIVFGKDQIKRIGDLIPQDAKVLILYGGGSVKKFGTFDRVVEALGNREWAEFSGIEANPTYETLIQAVDKIKAELTLDLDRASASAATLVANVNHANTRPVRVYWMTMGLIAAVVLLGIGFGFGRFLR